MDRCLGRRPAAVITGKHRPSRRTGRRDPPRLPGNGPALLPGICSCPREVGVLAARAGLRQGRGQRQLALSHLTCLAQRRPRLRSRCFNRLPALPGTTQSRACRSRSGVGATACDRSSTYAMLLGKGRLQSGGDLVSRASARQQLAALFQVGRNASGRGQRATSCAGVSHPVSPADAPRIGPGTAARLAGPSVPSASAGSRCAVPPRQGSPRAGSRWWRRPSGGT